MKQLFTIIFILSFAVCKSQSSITFNTPSATEPFKITATDGKGRVVALFAYYPLSNRLRMGGDQKIIWKWFVNQFFVPVWEIYESQQAVFEYLRVDGTVTDQAKFTEAMKKYLTVKNKYGM